MKSSWESKKNFIAKKCPYYKETQILNCQNFARKGQFACWTCGSLTMEFKKKLKGK